MKGSSKLLKSILLLAGTGMLGACGGGGGGDGGGTSLTAADPVSVTSANAATVAGAAVESADGLSGSSGGALGVFPASVGQTAGTQIGVIDTLLQQVKRAPEFLSSGGSQVTAASVRPIDRTCESGSISGSFNDADGDLALSTGDSMSITANSCNLGGVIMNGSISVGNIIISGDEFNLPFRLQLNLQANNFSVTVNNETVRMHGSASITESSSDNVNFSTGFVANGIQISIPGDTVTLTSYSLQATDDGSNDEYTLSINGVISSNGLGGSVVVETQQLLRGVGFANPHEGLVVCTGADNTRVTLDVIDSINIQLLVDSDGDGVTDGPPIPMLWDDL